MRYLILSWYRSISVPIWGDTRTSRSHLWSYKTIFQYFVIQVIAAGIGIRKLDIFPKFLTPSRPRWYESFNWGACTLRFSKSFLLIILLFARLIKRFVYTESTQTGAFFVFRSTENCHWNYVCKCHNFINAKPLLNSGSIIILGPLVYDKLYVKTFSVLKGWL